MKALLLFLFICVGCGSDEKVVAPSPAANEKTVAPAPAPAAKEVATTKATAVDYVPAALESPDNNTVEGTPHRFVVHLYDRTAGVLVVAPAGGLTVNLTVSDVTNGADFLAPATEGAKTVTFKEGESKATYSVPTVDDNQDEPGGRIKITLTAGTGYTLGINDSQLSFVRDNDAVAGVRLWVDDSDYTRGTSSSHLNIPESGGRQALTATVWLIGEDGKPITRSSDTSGGVVDFENTGASVETVSGDFTALTGATALTIPAGKSYAEKVMYVTPKRDTVQEPPSGSISVSASPSTGRHTPTPSPCISSTTAGSRRSRPSRRAPRRWSRARTRPSR